MFNITKLNMNTFIKYIWQLIISTSIATLEVSSVRPLLTTTTTERQNSTLAETKQNTYMHIPNELEQSWPLWGRREMFHTSVSNELFFMKQY